MSVWSKETVCHFENFVKQVSLLPVDIICLWQDLIGLQWKPEYVSRNWNANKVYVSRKQVNISSVKKEMIK